VERDPRVAGWIAERAHTPTVASVGARRAVPAPRRRGRTTTGGA